MHRRGLLSLLEAHRPVDARETAALRATSDFVRAHPDCFERTLLVMQAAGVEVPAPPRAEVYVARVDDSVSAAVFSLAQNLRNAGIAAELDHQGRSLKAQFKQADRLGARLVAVVGPDEVAAGEFTLRDMSTKDEKRVALDSAAAAVVAALG